MRSPLPKMLRRPILPTALATAALLILAAAAIACVSATGDVDVDVAVDTGRPYRIGVMDSLTGAGETYGTAIWQAKQLAADEINAAGGINGRMLELVVADGMCNAAGATAGYRRLTDVSGVKIILGASCSTSTLTAAPLAQADGVAMLSASATHPDVAGVGDYIFRTALSGRQVGIAAGNAMWADGVRNLATITENTDYARGLNEVAAARFAELGGSITAAEMFESGRTDFTPLLESLMASNPDAIYLVPQSDQSGGSVIRDARAVGYDGPIYAEVVTMGRESLNIAGDAAVGVKAVMVALPDDRPKVRELMTSFAARYGYTPQPWFVSSAYDTVYLASECLKQTGDDQDAAGFRDCLNDITWSGVISDDYSFDADGEIVGLSPSIVEPLPVAERTPANHGIRITGPAPAAP